MRQWSVSSPTAVCGWGRCCPYAAKTLTARPSRSAAPPTRAKSSKGRRLTTASPTPAAWSPSPRPSPGCSKRNSKSATTAICCSRPQLVACGRERNFYRDLWRPAQEASGLDIQPHECRHRYVTHLRAAGVDDADLAEIAGHRVETMLATYTHATEQSFDAVRGVLGLGSWPNGVPLLLVDLFEDGVLTNTDAADILGERSSESSSQGSQ